MSRLRTADGLKHVQVAIAVAGVKGVDGDGDEEIAAVRSAVAFALCVVAGAIDFMHGMGDVPGESRLHQDPLILRGSSKGGDRKQEGNSELHFLSQNLRWMGHETATMEAP